MSAPNVNGYGRPDPIKLATTTIKAVDQIGNNAADEVERTIKQLNTGMAEITEMLSRLAITMRDVSRAANEHVTQFCSKATEVMENVRGMQEKLNPPLIEAQTEDDGEPVPSFITKPREANELQ